MRLYHLIYFSTKISFNSRTPGGVRHLIREHTSKVRRFNSRTPGGVRRRERQGLFLVRKFQFTHPGRGATIYGRGVGTQQGFQFTHPGRGATSSLIFLTNSEASGFNSRTPGGVRPTRSAAVWRRSKTFQFTHPGRGATGSTRRRLPYQIVSIHAPREGCDRLVF